MWTEDQLVRVIVYLGVFIDTLRTENPNRHYFLPEDVADCIEWAKERYESN